MKARLLVFLTIVVMVVVLVALNAASYVRVEREGDREYAPDRSTTNAGGTGTRAFFDYLQQSGRDAARWTQPVASLSEGGADAPATFVIVGPTRHAIEKRETEAILRWVWQGGRLVLIDRSPPTTLLPDAGRWRVGSQLVEIPDPDIRPEDVERMTRDVPLVAPSQPTALTRDVAEVTRSRFAGRLHVYPVDSHVPRANVGTGPPAPSETPAAEDEEPWGGDGEYAEPPPAQSGGQASPPPRASVEAAPDSPAPVLHVPDGREGSTGLLVDYAYGRGRIVVLSDPFVISNAGVNRADNLFLGTNVVTGGRSGRVAFDEFHHGHGAARNEIFAYFRGTPVLWMFAQGALIGLALVWTRARRFARPLPAPRQDRRSKLEFVASMAELQQRARAYDLAIENVYTRTRRALARYGGVGADAPAEQIAARVAARSGKDARKLEALLRECEDVTAGAQLKPRRAVALARELRELERDLGILMRSRELRQAGAR